MMHKYVALLACALLAITANAMAVEEHGQSTGTPTAASQGGDLWPALKPLSFLEGTWNVQQKFVMPQHDRNARVNQQAAKQPDIAAREPAQSENSGQAGRQFPPQQRFQNGEHDAQQALFMNGTFRVRRALNGRALIGNFEGEGFHGGEFRGHMVLASEGHQRNPEQGAPARADAEPYTAYWADSMGITSFSRNVQWQDDTLSIEAADWFGARQGAARVTYHKIDNDHVDFKMEAKTARGWQMFAVGRYVRANMGETQRGPE